MKIHTVLAGTLWAVAALISPVAQGCGGSHFSENTYVKIADQKAFLEKKELVYDAYADGRFALAFTEEGADASLRDGAWRLEVSEGAEMIKWQSGKPMGLTLFTQPHVRGTIRGLLVYERKLKLASGEEEGITMVSRPFRLVVKPGPGT